MIVKGPINGFDRLVPLKDYLTHNRQKRDCTEKISISDTDNQQQPGTQLLENVGLFNIDWRLSRWDSKHRYKFLDFVWPGNKFLKLSQKYTVSIATQSSLEKLHSIVEMSRHWTGPISLAVFVAGEEFLLTGLYISYLRRCFPHVEDQISFHLAYSWDNPPSDAPNLAFDYKQDCSNPELVLSELLKLRSPQTIEWKNNSLYPQNHLRNQARINCQTEYIYLIDVDIIPCIGMADNLDQFLRKSQCEKLCAYVIPVYEIEDKAGFPRNKSELLKLAKNKMARPFHEKIHTPAQSATDYTRWQNNSEDVTEAVHVNHNVTKCKLGYEPFYVARVGTPDYDERFIGYGWTRNTQAYEMITAGYQFQVLSPIFSCHWGLQSYNRIYNPWRKLQLKKNAGLVKSFKAEMAARYPEVKQTC